MFGDCLLHNEIKGKVDVLMVQIKIRNNAIKLRLCIF